MAPSHASGLLDKRCAETLQHIQRTQVFYFFFFSRLKVLCPLLRTELKESLVFEFREKLWPFFLSRNILFCCLTPDKPPLFHCSTSDKLNSWGPGNNSAKERSKKIAAISHQIAMFCLRFGRVERFYQASSCGWYATGNTFSPGMNRHYIETFIYSTQELACSIGDKQTMLLHFFFHVSKFSISARVFLFFTPPSAQPPSRLQLRHYF